MRAFGLGQPISTSLNKMDPVNPERSATPETAGLDLTLHILEGVAAEGKEWIGHERQSLRDLASAVPTLFG